MACNAPSKLLIQKKSETLRAKGSLLTNLTLDTGKPQTRSSRSTQDSAAAPIPTWLLIAIALGLGLVLSYARVLDVWQKGTFFDSDDAMRLVQVRALLHGQGWFDLTAYRLDPPQGVFMHWSRFIDLPLALLIKLFGLVLPETLAERASRLTFPLILQGLLYLGMARIARALIGPQAIVPVIVLTLLSGMEVGQFQPGRIHHSAPQIMLTVWMIATFLEALDADKARHAAIAGLLAAISLAVGLEAFPFIVLLAGFAALLWILHGAEMQKSLGYFALGLGVSLPLTYLATVGHAHWFDTVCDAYSPVYLVPGFVGALALGGLALASSQLTSLVARIAAELVAGTLVLGAALAIKPICFIDPYHGIDPLVRQIWLNNVIEGFPLRRLYAQDAGTAIMMAGPIGVCIGAAFIALFRETGVTRERWLIVTAMSLAAAALSFWMIRLMSFAALISCFGGAWSIVTLRDTLLRTKWREISMLSFALVLPFSTVGWALVVPTKTDRADWKEGTGCLTSSAYAPLAQLPPGIVAGPIDAGSHMLAFTQQSVLAAPYHRDNDGNRAMLEAMLAKPADARAILAAHHVTYVTTCAGLKETDVLAKRAPQGLAAALIADHIPEWLRPLPIQGPFHVFVTR